MRFEESPPYGWAASDPPESCNYLVPPVLSVLRSLPARRVLDLGCGNGVLLEHLMDAGYDAVGLDRDSDALRLARARCPRVPLYQLSIDDDPSIMLGPDSRLFDAVVATEVIEHLLFPRHLVRFALRTLVDNGHLILTTPYHGYIKNLALAGLNKFDHHHHPLRDGGHVKFFSYATMRELLAEEGFRVVRIFGAGRLPFLWKSMVVLASRA